MSIELGAEAERFLAEQQQSALVVGGPGSGKTTLALLKAKQAMQSLAPGQEVLFMSFSRAAVRQVIFRSGELLNREERKRIHVRTYHGFFLDTLQAHGRLLLAKPLRVLTPTQEALLKADHKGDWLAAVQDMAEDGTYVFETLAQGCFDLLEKSHAVRSLVADKYPLMIVDEFQDTDDGQWKLVRMLAEGSRLIALADEQQSIYQYNKKVDPRRVEKFSQELTPQKYDLGGQNHRSPGSGLLLFADAVLENRVPLPIDQSVRLVDYPANMPSYADSLLQVNIIQLFQELRHLGIQQPTVAILCRTNPHVEQVSRKLDVARTLKGRSIPPINHAVLLDSAQLVNTASEVTSSVLE